MVKFCLEKVAQFKDTTFRFVVVRDHESFVTPHYPATRADATDAAPGDDAAGAALVDAAAERWSVVHRFAIGPEMVQGSA